MWYYLTTTIKKREHLIELKGSYQNMLRFFILNIDNDMFIQNAPLRGIAPEGFTDKLLLSTDFLEEMLDIPIFSKRFVETLGHELQEYAEFYSCQIYLHGIGYPFYLARIKNCLSIIDEQKSGYRLLPNGNKIIDEPIIIKDGIDTNLLIVKDLEYPFIVVSESFKQMVKKAKLKIGFMPTYQMF